MHMPTHTHACTCVHTHAWLQVDRIKWSLALDKSLSLTAALRAANDAVELRPAADASLPVQADALLGAIGI